VYKSWKQGFCDNSCEKEYGQEYCQVVFGCNQKEDEEEDTVVVEDENDTTDQGQEETTDVTAEFYECGS